MSGRIADFCVLSIAILMLFMFAAGIAAAVYHLSFADEEPCSDRVADPGCREDATLVIEQGVGVCRCNTEAQCPR